MGSSGGGIRWPAGCRVLVTVVAVTALGEQLNATELLGVALLCSALGTLVLVNA